MGFQQLIFSYDLDVWVKQPLVKNHLFYDLYDTVVLWLFYTWNNKNNQILMDVWWNNQFPMYRFGIIQLKQQF